MPLKWPKMLCRQKKDTDEDKSGFLIMSKLIKLDQDNTLIQFSLRFVYFSMHYILSRLFSAPLPQPNCLVCHSGRPVTDEYWVGASYGSLLLPRKANKQI